MRKGQRRGEIVCLGHARPSSQQTRLSTSQGSRSGKSDTFCKLSSGTTFNDSFPAGAGEEIPKGLENRAGQGLNKFSRGGNWPKTPFRANNRQGSPMGGRGYNRARPDNPIQGPLSDSLQIGDSG